MTIFQYSVYMCQLYLYTEFQLPITICTMRYTSPTEHKDLFYRSKKNHSSVTVILLLLFISVRKSCIPKNLFSYNVPKLGYRPPHPKYKNLCYTIKLLKLLHDKITQITLHNLCIK